jgi:hypothetical protein
MTQVIKITDFIEHCEMMIFSWRWWRFAWIRKTENKPRAKWCAGRRRVIGRLFFKMAGEPTECNRCRCGKVFNLKLGCECYCHPYPPYIEKYGENPSIDIFHGEQNL